MTAEAASADERRRSLLQAHIGNYALYMTGIFHESLEYRHRYKRRPIGVHYYADMGGSGIPRRGGEPTCESLAKAFKSGREFAAWLGIVPRQTGSGGRIRLLGISKLGDTYLRTLLIHGARSVLTHAKEPEPWIVDLCRRRPLNGAVVALAHKMARTIWALLAHERTYQKGFVSRPA